MRKRLLSLILALCLCVSIGMSAYAAQPEENSAESEDSYVAQIGENKYTDFQTALNTVSNGETVTLLSDVAGSYFMAFTTYTLDLNGYTIRNDADAILFLVFQSYGLTIIDSAGGGTVESDSVAETILNNGALRICSGTIIGKEYAVYSNISDGNGSLIVEGGTIESSNTAIYVEKGSLYVLGGTIQSGGEQIPAIKANTGCSVGISGGKIIGAVDESFYTQDYVSQESPNYYYEDISEYRLSEGYTAPVQEGKIFSGWYKDAAYTEYMTEAEANTPGTGAYAKFVAQNVLSLGRQITYGTTVDSEGTDLRLITTVDSDRYRSVGFSMQFGETARERTFTTVYKSILGKSGELLTEYQPSLFSEDSQYFLAFLIEDIPNTEFSTSFTITPFWVTPDGTRVEGTSSTFSISETIEQLE